jgi:opine dehydrogenase
MEKHITIIGGGNGASAAAADLSYRGFKVAWYELPQFESSVAEVIKLKGINIEALPSSGSTSGFVKIDTITTDIEKALAGSELVLVIVPSFAQETIARVCAPHLRDDHIVVLTPGNFGGSIRFRQILQECGCREKVTVAEAECMMYACRKKNPTTIWLRGFKRDLGLAAFPATDTDRVLAKVRQLYPHMIKSPDVLVTGLSNLNFLVHLPIVLGNLSNIENGTEALFYHAGMTPAIGRMIDAMEAERISLRKVGLQLRPIFDIMKGYYTYQGAAGNTIWEFCRTNPVYDGSKLPKTLAQRYLLEDIPYGLIPMLKLLDKFGLPNTHIKLVVDTLCMASGFALYEQARDLKKLGLDHLSGQELLEFVSVGGKSAKA